MEINVRMVNQFRIPIPRFALNIFSDKGGTIWLEFWLPTP